MFGGGIEDDELSKGASVKIGTEVKKIMDEALRRANEVLTTHRQVLDAIANKLIEVETLEQPEYEMIIKKFGIEPKKLEVEKKGIDVTG